MGTTLVALLSGPHEYTIANVGDSRAYRVGGEEIRQVTEDHSFAFEALGKGMSQEEIDASPWRNALTRVIGTDPQVEVDVFGPFSTEEPHHVCLCTDGLYRALSSERMLEVIRESPDLECVSKRLAELAYREGSADNITVALLSVGNGNAVVSPVDLASSSVAGVHPRFSAADPVWRSGSRQRPWRRRIRLSHKAKIELWGGVITILLALALAYLVL
jgi:serine/threonine protein phosphatase PrpC